MRSVACEPGTGEVECHAGAAEVARPRSSPRPRAPSAPCWRGRASGCLRRSVYERDATDPPPARSPHMRQRRPHEPDAREQVRLDAARMASSSTSSALPCGRSAGVRLRRRRGGRTARSPLDSRSGVSRLGHIRPDGERPPRPASGPQLLFGVRQRLLPLGRDDDAGALGGERFGRRTAEALRRGRHDRDAPFESEIHSSASLPRPRRRPRSVIGSVASERAVLGGDHDVLDARPEPAGQIDAGLDRESVPGGERCRGCLPPCTDPRAPRSRCRGRCGG